MSIVKKKKRFTYKFRDSWMQLDEFKNWLKRSSKVQNNNEFAKCIICNDDILAHKADIRRHGLSSKHKKSFSQVAANNKIDNVFGKNTQLDLSTRRAELKLTGLLAANDLPFLLMDILGPLCKDIFPDSQVAKNISIRRTKATAIM